MTMNKLDPKVLAHIRRVLYGVQFEERFIDGRKRVLEQIKVATKSEGSTLSDEVLRSLHEAQAYKGSLQEATGFLCHSEEEIRNFLGSLQQALEEYSVSCQMKNGLP